MGIGLRGHKIFFIVNPQAGGGKAAARWQRLLPRLERQGLDFFWQYSGGGTKTSAQVRRAVFSGSATAVVAVGGDGHVHDTINGLIEEDALIQPGLVFAVYPAGSACDFARMIYRNGGDTSGDGLIELLCEGEVRMVDIGRADFWRDNEPLARYFINGSDIGLGALTCVRVNAEGGRFKRLIKNGRLAFMLAAQQALFSYGYVPITVEADGKKQQGQYLIAAVGNGCYMGGKMRMFPPALLDDGLLDLLLVRRMPKPKAFVLFAKVYDGTLLQLSEVSYCRVKSVSIIPEHPLALELDGELPGHTPLEIRVLPELLPLLFFAPKYT